MNDLTRRAITFPTQDQVGLDNRFPLTNEIFMLNCRISDMQSRNQEGEILNHSIGFWYLLDTRFVLGPVEIQEVRSKKTPAYNKNAAKAHKTQEKGVTGASLCRSDG